MKRPEAHRAVVPDANTGPSDSGTDRESGAVGAVADDSLRERFLAEGAATLVIFSRDCAEYEIRTPNGNTLLLLVNHFKSKGSCPSSGPDG